MTDQFLHSFIAAHRLTHVAAESVPLHGMGNGIDVYSLGKTKLRIVSDRGQRFIDVWCTDAGEWKDVFTLVATLDPSFKPKTGSFTEAIQTLNKYWPEVLSPVEREFKPRAQDER